MMATVSRLPMVRVAKDKRSSGWVSTLSEMARSVPHWAEAGQYLCGTTGPCQLAPAQDGGHRQEGQPDLGAMSRRGEGSRMLSSIWSAR